MEDVRIAVLDHHDNIVGIMDNSVDDAMHFYDDELHTYLEGSAYTFNFKVYADYEDVDILQCGYHLSFIRTSAEGKQKGHYLNIVSVENDGTEVVVECYGLLFELINEDIQPYQASGPMTFEQYMSAFGFDSTIIHIDINEVSDKSIQASWSDSDTVLSRLYALADTFGAEIEFVTELGSYYGLERLTMNVYRAHDDEYQGLGRDRTSEILRVGKQLLVTKHKEDITELYTAIRPTGANDINLSGLGDRSVLDENGNVLYWHPSGSIVIFAPQSKEMYPSTALSTADGWIAHNWSCEAADAESLYSQALAELKQHCVPQVSYTVEGFIDAEIGDTFTLADEKRGLYVSARIVEQIICMTDPDKSRTTFDNFTTLQSRLF